MLTRCDGRFLRSRVHAASFFRSLNLSPTMSCCLFACYLLSCLRLVHPPMSGCLFACYLLSCLRLARGDVTPDHIFFFFSSCLLWTLSFVFTFSYVCSSTRSPFASLFLRFSSLPLFCTFLFTLSTLLSLPSPICLLCIPCIVVLPLLLFLSSPYVSVSIGSHLALARTDLYSRLPDFDFCTVVWYL